MIEATEDQIVLILVEFKENGIPKGGLWIQPYEGKKYVDVISTIVGEKHSVANRIVKEIIWSSTDNVSSQAE